MKPRGRVTLRPANDSEARSLHALISANLAEGHLLPRTLDELAVHAAAIRRGGARAANRRLRRARRLEPAGCGSPLTRGRQPRARQGRRHDDRRRAAAARAARRLRKALRVHARAGIFHPDGILDCSAHVAAREAHDRLRQMPALPNVRAVCDGRADRRRSGKARRIGLRHRPRLRQSRPADVARYA